MMAVTAPKQRRRKGREVKRVSSRDGDKKDANLLQQSRGDTGRQKEACRALRWWRAA